MTTLNMLHDLRKKNMKEKKNISRGVQANFLYDKKLLNIVNNMV